MSQAAILLGLVAFIAGGARMAVKNGWSGVVIILVGLALIVYGFVTL